MFNIKGTKGYEDHVKNMDFYFCKCKWVAAKPVVVDPLLANTTQSNYTTRQNIPIHLDHAEEDNKKDDHNKDDHYKDDPNKEYHKKEDHNKGNHNKNMGMCAIICTFWEVEWSPVCVIFSK